MRNKIFLMLWLALGGMLSGAGCVEPELGDVPFFCNGGQPECPDGYQCIGDRCVRNGVRRDDAGVGGDPDQGSSRPTADLLMPFPETAPDIRPPPDTVPPDPDLGPDPDGSPSPQDTGPVTDGGQPVELCTSNSDCAPESPCCCLVQVVNARLCLPLCLDPFCI